jgi:pSer/pThr/pTyr-binding forkhead associated (FHA) protein
MYRITVEFGGKVVKTYDFNKPAITIGRELDNDIVIDNLGVSRHHCKVEEKPGGVHVATDMGSNNGTFIRGQRIATFNLNHGDVISIGKYTLTYDNPKQAAEALKEHKPNIMDMPTMEMSAGGKSGEAPKKQEVGPMTLQVDASDMERMQRERSTEVAAYLTFKVGAAPQQVPLQKSFMFIGKHDKADFKADGWRVMPRHAMLVRDAMGYTLVNLSSKKPTYLNDKAVDMQRLKNADVVKVGKFEFTFYVGKPK